MLMLFMKDILQSMLILMLALGLFVPAVDFAQSTSLSPSTDIILEVIATYSGMHCADCADRYLYVRVLPTVPLNASLQSATLASRRKFRQSKRH